MNALQALDTLIAFITVLTICSMFVLIVVQMVSAALSLRGKNLANALATTFQTVAPELKGNAHALAQRILCNPALSDSAWKDKDIKSPGDAYKESQWSAWSLSTDAFNLANAIRPEEVLAALQKLKELKPTGEQQKIIDKGKAEGATVAEKKASEETEKAWAPEKSLRDAATKLLEAAGLGQVIAKEKMDAVLTIAGNVADEKQKRALISAINDASAKIVSVVQTAENHLTDWLNSAQDRAQQWFQTNARNVTIVASVLFALVCQIDALELFQHVSTDSKARQALVDASAKLISEGGDALADKGLPERVAAAWNEKQAGFKIDPNPSWQRVDEVKAEAQKKNAPNFDIAFDAAEKTATKAYFEDKEKRLRGLEETFKATGFDIFPAGGRRWNKEGTVCPLWDEHYLAHVPGMLLFAGLLSLGAPYWFNLLKNLASLRPALAKLIGEERQADNAPKK